MQIAIQEIQKKQQQEIDQINKTLKARSQKFNSEYIPLTLADYKIYKIKKASETGKMQYLEGILLSDIQDLQQRKRKIKQRTDKFFPNISVQTDQDKFFNKRENPDFTEDTTKIRYDAWYLFGVDYMSNQKIRNYFHTNPHFKIQWINDSSCNIAFNTKQQAVEAIQPYIKGDSMKDEHQIWYQLQQYEVDGIKRKLFCRQATNKDVKNVTTTGKESKYYRWETNKKKINNYVKQKATQYINKQKKIRKDNTTRVKKQEQGSSSGLDSDNEGNKNNDMNQDQEINQEMKEEVNDKI